MAKTNIPTSLITSTQIPVDGKTYKNTLSEITTVNTEQAFTYYAGMIVTVASNNKQYIWKQVEVGKSPISTIYNYPANHVVEGFDYSDKAFGFYEYKPEVTAPDPEPDGRIIYRTEIHNLPMPSITEAKPTWGVLYMSKTVDVNPDNDNYKTEHFNFSPLASTTINISRRIGQTDPNGHNPLWLEYVPNTKGPTIIVPPDEIGQAIEDGNDSIIIKPNPGSNTIDLPVVQLPPNRDIGVFIPWDGDLVIKGPTPSSPIFQNSSGGSKVKLQIGSATSLKLDSPLAINSDIELVGGGKIKASNSSTPIFSGSSKINIKDVSLDLENISLASLDSGSTLTLSNVNTDVKNTTIDLIKSTDSTVSLNNSKINIKDSIIQKLITAEGSSSLELNNTTLEGSAQKVFAVSDGNETIAPKISVNNSNFEKLEANSLFSNIDTNTSIVASNLKINNTLFLDSQMLDNSITGFKHTNTIVDGDNTGTGSGGDMLKSENLSGLTNYDLALTNLNVYSKGEVDALIDAIDGSEVTKQYVDDADDALSIRISNLENQLPVDLSAYETIANNNTKLANKANVSDLNTLNSRVDNLTTRVENLENGGGSLDLQEFPTRAAANGTLPNHTFFINTNDNNENKSTWFLDITII